MAGICGAKLGKCDVCVQVASGEYTAFAQEQYVVYLCTVGSLGQSEDPYLAQQISWSRKQITLRHWRLFRRERRVMGMRWKLVVLGASVYIAMDLTDEIYLLQGVQGGHLDY